MIEVSRNQGLKGLERSDLANAGLAELSQRVPMQTGTAPDFSVAKAAGFDVREGAGDMVVDCAHSPDRAHSSGLRKPKSHCSGLAKLLSAHYEVHMPFDLKAMQTAIRAVSKRKHISLTAWSLKAGFSRNMLTQFVKKERRRHRVRDNLCPSRRRWCASL